MLKIKIPLIKFIHIIVAIFGVIMTLSSFYISNRLYVNNSNVPKNIVSLSESGATFFNSGGVLTSIKVKDPKFEQYNSRIELIEKSIVPIMTFFGTILLIPLIQSLQKREESRKRIKMFAISHKVHELLISTLRYFYLLGATKYSINKSILDYIGLVEYINYKHSLKLNSNKILLDNDTVFFELINQDIFYNSGKKDKRGTKNKDYENIDIDLKFKNNADKNFERGFESLINYIEKELVYLKEEYIDNIYYSKDSLNNKYFFGNNNKKKFDFFFKKKYDYVILNTILHAQESLIKQIYQKGGIYDDNSVIYLSRIIEIIGRINWKVKNKKVDTNGDSSNFNEYIGDFYLLLLNIHYFYKKNPDCIIRSFFDFENILKEE